MTFTAVFISVFFFFFFNDTATTEIYTLSLHDALPICPPLAERRDGGTPWHAHHIAERYSLFVLIALGEGRSEEHTSELQSLRHLVCRLLLEKKKQTQYCKVRVSAPTCRS